MRNGKNYLQRNLSANHYNKNDILNFVDDSINFTNEKNILNNFDFDQSNFDTTNFGRNDFKNNSLVQIGNIPGWIDVYKSDNRILFDAYHPSRKGREYVNTLIKALNDFFPIVKSNNKYI